MTLPPYQVQLPVFEGPLDLLLHLIEQQELDITVISLAQVTDQYLAYLRIVKEVHPDDLADFMVVAAQLLLIKSRALLPQPPKTVEEQDQVGEDLVRQLYEYRRFKRIAQILQQRDQEGQHMYPRTVPPSKLMRAWKPKANLEGVSLDGLITALHALLSQQVEAGSEFSVVPYTVTIEDKIARIDALFHSSQVLTFDSLLDDAGSRIEVIVTLLAILEMIRNGRVSVRQEHLFGEIWITCAEPPKD
jgi:segregation and condensation protein A